MTPVFQITRVGKGDTYYRRGIKDFPSIFVCCEEIPTAEAMNRYSRTNEIRLRGRVEYLELLSNPPFVYQKIGNDIFYDIWGRFVGYARGNIFNVSPKQPEQEEYYDTP